MLLKNYEGCVVGQESYINTVPVGLVPESCTGTGFPQRLLISPYQPPYHQSSLLSPDSVVQRTQFSSIPLPTHIGNIITAVSESLTLVYPFHHWTMPSSDVRIARSEPDGTR